MASRPTVRVGVAPRPRTRVQTIPKFPAQVEVADGLLLDKTGGVFTFSLDPDFFPSFDSALPFTRGDILFADGPASIAKLADVAPGSLLLSGGVGQPPAYGKADLGLHVTGTLPFAHGGTGLDALTQGDILFASATDTLARLPKNGNATRYLANTGASNSPAWDQIDLTTGVTQRLPIDNGGFGDDVLDAGATTKFWMAGDVTLLGVPRGILGNLYFRSSWKYGANGSGGIIKFPGDGNAITFEVAGVNSSGSGAAASPIGALAITVAGETVARAVLGVADIRYFGATWNGSDYDNVALAVDAAVAEGWKKISIPKHATYIPTGNTTPAGVEIIGEDWELSVITVPNRATDYVQIGAHGKIINCNIRHRFGDTDPVPPGTQKDCPVGTAINQSNTATIITNWPYTSLWIFTGTSTNPGGTTATDVPIMGFINDGSGDTFYGATSNTALGFGNNIHLDTKGADDNGILIGNGSANPGNVHTGMRIQEYSTNAGARSIWLDRYADGSTPLYYSDNAPGPYTASIAKFNVNYQTSGNFFQFDHATSAFTGDVIFAHLANGSGSASGNFLHFAKNGADKFLVTSDGTVFLNTFAQFRGATSGATNIAVPAVAGDYNFNLPLAAGSSGQPLLSGGGGTTAMTFGTLGLTYGGTNANLSATGGTSQVLRQSTVGGAITVGQLAASDLSNGVLNSGAVLLASTIDTDATLSGNSDTKAPSQKAIKSYVDNNLTGLTWKPAVLVKTTGNITLSGEQTIDGQLTSASRVLVGSQSTASQNGIYVSAAGSWTRATDADSGAELVQATVFVQKGTANADTQWTCTNDSITLGSTSITFAQVSGAGTYSAGTGLSLTGNQFSIDATVATLSGSQALTGKTYNGLTISTSTGTLTITNGKTASVSNTLAFSGTDGSSVAFGAGGTVLYSGGAAGTPSSITLTNGTGFPFATGGTGVLPIANGGTNDTGTAWTTSTPTVVCAQSTGTAIGTAAARTKTIGKTVFWDVTITISGTFTGGSITSVALPVTAGAGNYVVSGRETALTGAGWNGLIVSGGTVCNPSAVSGSNTIVTGETIILTGVFESA